jgi:hypothetical protein
MPAAEPAARPPQDSLWGTQSLDVEAEEDLEDEEDEPT